MGIEIDREHFDETDYARFRERLTESIDVLDEVLARPGFGKGPAELGAELEVSLTDGSGAPLPMSESVLRRTVDERMTLEIDRFNLECNLNYCELAGRPFENLRRELESAHAELVRAAGALDGRVAVIGILPTLGERDLGRNAMVDAPRYRVLSNALRSLRKEPFRLHIEGEDVLELDCEDVTFEGAATSFQLHLRVAPEDFTSVFNAAQISTAPVLAVAGNSPTFLGRRLWEETRVALFKQSVDARRQADRDARKQARVSLGSQWLAGGPIELFREAVDAYPILLPACDEERPRDALERGETPSLREIRLHQGTVWHWNRPVYDAHRGGHVRMELRALPAGPTIIDMVANAAFSVGLALGLAPRMAEVVDEFEFEQAHRNFYRAASDGLAAELVWPRALGGTGDLVTAQELVPALADRAREGLRAAGVEPDEYDPLIDLIVARARSGQTGSAWQRSTLAKISDSGCEGSEALRRMFEAYLVRSAAGEPVHLWSEA